MSKKRLEQLRDFIDIKFLNLIVNHSNLKTMLSTADILTVIEEEKTHNIKQLAKKSKHKEDVSLQNFRTQELTE